MRRQLSLRWGKRATAASGSVRTLPGWLEAPRQLCTQADAQQTTTRTLEGRNDA